MTVNPLQLITRDFLQTVRDVDVHKLPSLDLIPGYVFSSSVRSCSSCTALDRDLNLGNILIMIFISSVSLSLGRPVNVILFTLSHFLTYSLHFSFNGATGHAHIYTHNNIVHSNN